ncbi:hypothetical protein ACVFI8_16785 [Agarivorans sp. MS3-6]
MLFKQSQYKARVSLLLLAALLAVCVAKNVGLNFACPNAHLVSNDPLSSQLHSNESCQFAEHLLKQHVQTLEQLFVVVLFLSLSWVSVLCVTCYRPLVKPSIPPPRRLYLRECHFRE